MFNGSRARWTEEKAAALFALARMHSVEQEKGTKAQRPLLRICGRRRGEYMLERTGNGMDVLVNPETNSRFLPLHHDRLAEERAKRASGAVSAFDRRREQQADQGHH